jgi:hypothetical protein
MTPVIMKRAKILDGEKLFYLYYVTMGSARSIVKVKKQLGRDAINPNTGRPVQDMAIWWSMYRWAFNNIDLSYQIFNDAMLDEGKYHTKEEWFKFVEKKARLIKKKSEKAFQRWQQRVNQSV